MSDKGLMPYMYTHTHTHTHITHTAQQQKARNKIKQKKNPMTNLLKKQAEDLNRHFSKNKKWPTGT